MKKSSNSVVTVSTSTTRTDHTLDLSSSPSHPAEEVESNQQIQNQKKVIWTSIVIFSLILIITLPVVIVYLKSSSNDSNNNLINPGTNPPIQPLGTAGTIDSDGIFSTLWSQPLSATLPTLGSLVASGKAMDTYANCDELEEGVHSASSIIINAAIAYAVNKRSYYGGHNRDYYGYNIMEMNSPQAASEDQSEKQSDRGKKKAGNRGEDSFGTNNQVKGVEEADVVQSTEDLTFAAYGNRIVVWNVTSGKELSSTLLGLYPDVNQTSDGRFKKVRVKGLILQGDGRRLVVITSNNNSGNFRLSAMLDSSYRDTSVYLYDVSNVGVITTDDEDVPDHLVLLSSYFLPGASYTTARSIGDVAHIVVTSTLNLYEGLKRPFARYGERYKDFDENDVEYVNAAKYHAEKTVLPTFVESIMKDIKEKRGKCDHVVRLSLFQGVAHDEIGSTTAIPTIESSLMEGYSRILTFNMADDHEKELSVSVSGVFLPSAHSTEVYASEETILISLRGKELHRGPGLGDSQSIWQVWKEHTYIMAFALNDDGTKGVAVGSVPGYLINQWALDVWDGHVRVASIIRSNWGCSYDKNILDKNGVTASCIWKHLDDSDNRISVLKLPGGDDVSSSTEMEMVGYLNDLGEPGEKIEAIRFMMDKAFLVTFLRTDPFYTIDVSDHTKPRVVGELKVPG